MAKNLFLATLLMLLFPLAHAGEAIPTSDDPVLEKRVLEVSENLRCLVCQNQTIADSNAELAVDLRNQVREKLKAGQSEDEIMKYMVARYGDFVLFNPQVKSSTWLLWFGPLLMLAGGGWILIISLRNRRKLQQQTSVLSAEEHVQAASLLAEKNDGQKNIKDAS